MFQVCLSTPWLAGVADPPCPAERAAVAWQASVLMPLITAMILGGVVLFSWLTPRAVSGTGLRHPCARQVWCATGELLALGDATAQPSIA